MPSIMNKNIEQIFNALDSPKSSYDYSCKQFNKSNLWIVKDNNGNCGFLIENAHDSDKLGEYKNLDAKTWDVVNPLAEIIKESNAMSRVYIASFSDRRVRYLSKILEGKVKTVAGTSQVIKFIIGFLTGFRFSFSADFIQVSAVLSQL